MRLLLFCVWMLCCAFALFHHIYNNLFNEFGAFLTEYSVIYPFKFSVGYLRTFHFTNQRQVIAPKILVNNCLLPSSTRYFSSVR